MKTIFQLTRFPGKIKQWKSDEFQHDFDLYSSPRGNGQPSSVGFQLPDIFQSTGQESIPNFDFKGQKGNEEKIEKRINEVTRHLATIYKNKRMQVFHNMAKTRVALRSKEFFRLYTGSTSIPSKRSVHAAKLRQRFQKPKKPFNYEMEYERLRGLRESEEELAKVQAYIDRMIAKNIKKYQDEKMKQQAKEEKVEIHYPTLQELVIILVLKFLLLFLIS